MSVVYPNKHAKIKPLHLKVNNVAHRPQKISELLLEAGVRREAETEEPIKHPYRELDQMGSTLGSEALHFLSGWGTRCALHGENQPESLEKSKKEREKVKYEAEDRGNEATIIKGMSSRPPLLGSQHTLGKR